MNTIHTRYLPWMVQEKEGYFSCVVIAAVVAVVMVVLAKMALLAGVLTTRGEGPVADARFACQHISAKDSQSGNVTRNASSPRAHLPLSHRRSSNERH